MNAKQKFMMGKDLDAIELMEIPLIDRCRYVVDKFFKNGFSAKEVHGKLCQLNRLNEIFTPAEIHDVLVEYFGKPSSN